LEIGVANLSWWQALLLGLAQGLGEFLPISSSGHLVLFQNIFGITEEVLLLDTLLHVGTLAAVFFALWPDILPLIRRPFQKTTLLLVIATIPAVAVTLLLGDAIDRLFAGTYLGWGFLLTAIILLTAGRSRSHVNATGFYALGTWHALAMGTAQAVAILPGVSRSGSTIAGGLVSGVDRDAATRFSFLMSIPAILGSLVYQLKDLAKIGVAASSAGMSLAAVLLGMLVAAVSGFLALKWMLRIVRRGKLWVFGIYTGALAALVLLDQYLFHIIF
jgi:undecaprenyl-diphosphatase